MGDADGHESESGGGHLNIPASTTSVSVKIIDVSTIANVPAHALFTPAVAGYDVAPDCPSFVFLIEHPAGQKVLFDLGIRKDWHNLPTVITERFEKVGHRPSAEKNVSEVLDEAGVGKENINAIIWSHAHWDHTGDPSTFPGSTDLVVGRGFKEHFLSAGEGEWTLGGILKSDYEGRHLREISFTESNVVKIGQFAAYDYFSDGSLYLLDTPGHCVGHLCALVRTTTSPDTFLFLGGDAAHHCGEYRPSRYRPLPESVNITRQGRDVPFCPCSWYDDLQLARGRNPQGPLWQPAFGHNIEEVLTTIDYMQEYDGDDSILVILAHDAAFRTEDVPFFPATVNNWKERGFGPKLRWKWLGEILDATERNSGE